MPKGYLFDTVACSRWRRGDVVLRSKVEALPSDAALYTSVIKAFFVWMRRILADPFPLTLSLSHKGRGNPRTISSYKCKTLWITAIALTHDLVLITNDPDFDRVPGLQKENWLRG